MRLAPVGFARLSQHTMGSKLILTIDLIYDYSRSSIRILSIRVFLLENSEKSRTR